MPDCLAGAERIANGRVVIYAVATGARYERAEDSAADMVKSGAFAVARPLPEHTTDTPQATTPPVLVTPVGAARPRGKR